jgi:group I intron endonuclease
MKKQDKGIIGIYKITSPSEKSYIGQSKNIHYRFHIYRILHCKNQTKLYNSLKKYGPENHIFEIIEECSLDQLDEREIYWINYFNSTSKGLNLKEGGCFGKHSEETKNKISKTKKGTIINKSWALNISNGRKGLKHSNETKDKIKQSNTNKIVSEETKLKQRLQKLGTKRSIESKLKQGKSMKGKSQPKSFYDKKDKPILQYDLNGEFIKEWKSITEANNVLKIDKGSISNCINMKRQKTAGGFIWKIKK